MKAIYRKGRPYGDYRGADVVTPDGNLGRIIKVYYREVPPAYLAQVNHFNGEPFPCDFALLSLDILERPT